MKYSNRVPDGVILILRGLILVATLVANSLMHYERIFGSSLSVFYDMQFFTTEVNYLIMIWAILFFIWRNDDEKYRKLNGSIKGALTTYITIVALVYYILIAPTHHPRGLFNLHEFYPSLHCTTTVCV